MLCCLAIYGWYSSILPGSPLIMWQLISISSTVHLHRSWDLYFLLSSHRLHIVKDCDGWFQRVDLTLQPCGPLREHGLHVKLLKWSLDKSIQKKGGCGFPPFFFLFFFSIFSFFYFFMIFVCDFCVWFLCVIFVCDFCAYISILGTKFSVVRAAACPASRSAGVLVLYTCQYCSRPSRVQL